MSQQTDPTAEEFRLFAQRFMHFMNLYTVYRDLLSGHYVPTVNPPSESDFYPQTNHSLMLMLYAYFYSLVDHDSTSLNAFRIWRARFPEEETAIAALEAQVEPLRDDLKRFRNRLGFHGSRTYAHEASGFNVFANHTGTEILETINNFKAFGARLFAKDTERRKSNQRPLEVTHYP
jgi:hypothetical protein